MPEYRIREIREKLHVTFASQHAKSNKIMNFVIF